MAMKLGTDIGGRGYKGDNHGSGHQDNDGHYGIPLDSPLLSDDGEEKCFALTDYQRRYASV
jgi:hypothetical protein